MRARFLQPDVGLGRVGRRQFWRPRRADTQRRPDERLEANLADCLSRWLDILDDLLELRRLKARDEWRRSFRD
jgi:hypothetical protein